jgi:hypothetical protein
VRISDAHKFTDWEIARNETGNGWNADFIQKNTLVQNSNYSERPYPLVMS